MHNVTHKICPLRKHTATTGKGYNFFTWWGQIFVFGHLNVLWGR